MDLLFLTAPGRNIIFFACFGGGVCVANGAFLFLGSCRRAVVNVDFSSGRRTFRLLSWVVGGASVTCLESTEVTGEGFGGRMVGGEDITLSPFTSIHSESSFFSIYRVSPFALFGTAWSIFLFSVNLLSLADDSLLAAVSLDLMVTG